MPRLVALPATPAPSAGQPDAWSLQRIVAAMRATRHDLAWAVRMLARFDGPLTIPDTLEPAAYAQAVDLTGRILIDQLLLAAGELARLATLLLEAVEACNGGGRDELDDGPRPGPMKKEVRA